MSVVTVWIIWALFWIIVTMVMTAIFNDIDRKMEFNEAYLDLCTWSSRDLQQILKKFKQSDQASHQLFVDAKAAKFILRERKIL